MEIKRPRDEISVQRVLWGVGGGWEVGHQLRWLSLESFLEKSIV